MKKILLALCAIGAVYTTQAQEYISQKGKAKAKHEVKIGINSGLMAFKGNTTNNYTTLWQDINQPNFWQNSPYGSKGAIIFGGSLNYKRIGAKNWIFTLDAGYEFLRNKVTIDSIFNAQTGNTAAASGTHKMSFNFLNFSPMLGYRIKLPIVSIDLQAGADFAYMLSAEEKRDVKDAFGNIYQGITQQTPLTMDIRPRVQVNLNFARTSWYVGYSEGIMNYLNDATHADDKAVTSLIRAGVQLSLF